MKHNICRRCILVMLLVALLVCGVPAGDQVIAAPVMALSPTSGATGSSVTAAAAGLTAYASSTAYLFFGTTLVELAAINSSGTFSKTFIVPSGAAAGSYLVSLQTTAAFGGGTTIASATFTVSSSSTPSSITLSSNYGAPGSVITASGTLADYADWELYFFFDQDYRSMVTLAANGAYSGTIVIPSSATAGAHTISLQTVASYGAGSTLASATYTVSDSTPQTLALSPTSGSPGTTVTVTATGLDSYSSGDFLYVYFGTTPANLATVTATKTFTTNFSIPSGATSGSHVVSLQTSATYGAGTTITSATFTVTASPNLTIALSLQGAGRPDSGWAVPVTVGLFSSGADVLNDTPLFQFETTTVKSDAGANCSLSGITPGTYDITLVSEHTLLNRKRNVTLGQANGLLDMGTLLEGDANNDGIVDIQDFGILALAFSSQNGDPAWDARADFDRNGIVNVSDFGLLAVNFLVKSPIELPGPVPFEIVSLTTVNADEPAELVVKTLPEAHVLTWFVLPVTGTRSTRPDNR